MQDIRRVYSLSTSRGAGNDKSHFVKNIHCFSVQLPINLERGRKLKVSLATAQTLLRSYSYLSTSRGAGNGIPSAWRSVRRNLVYLLHLARGRKPIFPLDYKLFFRLYSSLSTSRGAGNCLPLRFAYPVFSVFVQLPIYLARGRKHLRCKVESVTLPVQIPIYLERGRKLVEQDNLKQLRACIAPYLPREGPETFVDIFLIENFHVQIPMYLERGRKLFVNIPVLFKLFSIAPYQPREGPETIAFSSNLSQSSLYSYLSTSRGAGNILAFSLFLTWSKWYRYLSTSAGAGNGNLVGQGSLVKYVQLPIYLERGRKLTLRARWCCVNKEVYLPIFLARGREPIPKINLIEVVLYSSLSALRGAGNQD